MQPPLKGVIPHGVGDVPKGQEDRSVRGEPPSGGGRVSYVKSFLERLGFMQLRPSSVPGYNKKHFRNSLSKTT